MTSARGWVRFLLKEKVDHAVRAYSSWWPECGVKANTATVGSDGRQLTVNLT